MARLLSLCVAIALSYTPRLASADRPAPLSAQTLKAPSGPASLKGLGESFQANAGSGTGSYSVAIQLPPGFVVPPLSLEYSGGLGRSEVGVGFQLPLLQVYRLTDKGAPKFDENDRFAVSGSGLNDELVLVDPVMHAYRLKNEGAFVLFLRDAVNDSWTLLMPKGDRSVLGGTGASRATANGKTARWLVSTTTDSFGHQLSYRYFTDSGKVYWQGADYQQEAASPAYNNHVEFDYEPRPDLIRDFRYGDLSQTSQRLKAISVYQGTRRLRKYTLSYEPAALWSLLSRVQMEGENGSSMPALALSYVQPTRHSGRFVRTEGIATLTGLDTGRMTLEDVTGDGLPDLLSGDASNYTYYENVDGVKFSGTAIPLGTSGSPDRNLDAAGVVMADVDGDGWRDVWYPTTDGKFRYFPGGKLDHGRFLGFGAVQTMNGNNVISDVTRADVRLMDMNGDGRTDLLFQRPGLGDVWIENQLARDLIQRSAPTLPSGVVLTSSALELQDFNGDGVLDLIVKEFDSTKHRLKVWYGLGSGKYWPISQDVAAPQASLKEVFLADVDHDGQTDLVRVSGSWVAYYLNDGSGALTNEQAEFNGMPETSRTKRVLMADMNGNGTTDIVWLTIDGALSYLDLIEDAGVGLLARIDNGMGLVTEVGYRSSSDYAINAKLAGTRWATPLPHPVSVISEVATRDSLDNLGVAGWEARTSYDYADGYYDGKEREFRGFALTTQTQWGDSLQETRIAELHTHVGRNLSTLADEESLKGKTWLQVVKSGDGSILSSDEAIWEQRWLCREDLGAGSAVVLPSCSGIADKNASKDSLVGLAVKVGGLQGSYERQAAGRYSASKFSVDVWGQTTRVDNYGEVSIPGGHVPGQAWAFSDLVTSTGDDETSQELDLTYLVDPANAAWLVGFATGQRLKTGAGALVSSSRIFYDGVGFIGLPAGQITKGLVSRREAFLPEENRWVALERSSFNGDGLAVEQLDATGGKSALDYDPETQFFPVTERRLIAANTELTFRAEYDRGFGGITSLTDMNAETTRYRYDGLGRLTMVIDPKGSESEPLVSYGYAYGTSDSPISVTTTRQLVARGQGVYRTSFDYFDGMGRRRLNKVQTEQGYIASGFQVLSPHGEAEQTFQAFRSSTVGFEAAPTSTPYGETRRDALGRVLEEHLPWTPTQGASLVVRQYLPFEARRFDERDSSEQTFQFPTTTRFDGLHRVREIEKKTQDGMNVVALKWSLSYDARGLIRTFKDPKSFTRTYNYDGLGRLKSLADPNLGPVSFGYDDAGRIVRRTDALQQEELVEYDVAGRVTREQMSKPNASGVLAVDAEYKYHYDTPAPNGPLSSPTHLVGRPSWIEYPTGTEYFSYDEHGQTERQAVTLWDGISPFAAQQRDTFQRTTTFDATGDEVSVSLPGGFGLSKRYDARGLIDRLTAGMPGAARDVISNVVYDQRGALIRADHGNGTRSCRSYDQRGLPAVVLLGGQSDVSCTAEDLANESLGAYHVAYQWSYDGLIAGVQDLSAASTRVARLDASFDYDRLHQLTGASNVGVAYTYSYDDVQNLTATRVQKQGQSAVDEIRTYGENAGPNALTHAGSVALSYDADGQLKSYHGFTLKFDVEGQLVEAYKPGGKRLSYHYDSSGERKLLVVTEGTTTRVFRYPFAEYEERDGEKVYRVQHAGTSVEYHRSQGLLIDATLLDELTSYVNEPAGKPKPLPQEWLDLDGDGDGFDAGDLAQAQQAFWQDHRAGTSRDEVRYVETDHLGSALIATDSGGAEVSARRYTPYGELAQRGGVQGTSGFVASDVEPDADLGLMRMGTRYYAPALARWVTPDRTLGDSADLNLRRPLESNLYSYSANNPITLADPSGGIAQWLAGVLIGAATDAAIQAIDIALDPKKTAKDFSLGSLGTSAVMGGVGIGLAGKLGKLAQLVSNPAVRKLAVVGLNAVADAVTSVVTNYAKKALFNVGDGVTVKGTVADVVGSFVGSRVIKWVGGKLAGARTLRAVSEAATFGAEEAQKAMVHAPTFPEYLLARDSHVAAQAEKASAAQAFNLHLDNYGLAGSGVGQSVTNGATSAWTWFKNQNQTPASGAIFRDELSAPKAGDALTFKVTF